MKFNYKIMMAVFSALFVGSLFLSCSDSDSQKQNGKDSAQADQSENRGIGPVKSVEIKPIDPALAKRGEKIYEEKCTACHKYGERYVGPDLAGVTKRRTPEWIMNMILNPVEMTKKDPVANELLAKFATQMTNQNVSKEQSRALLEFFRKKDQK